MDDSKLRISAPPLPAYAPGVSGGHIWGSGACLLACRWPDTANWTLTASTDQPQAAGNRVVGRGWVEFRSPQAQVGPLGSCGDHWGALWGGVGAEWCPRLSDNAVLFLFCFVLLLGCWVLGPALYSIWQPWCAKVHDRGCERTGIPLRHAASSVFWG